MNPHTKDLKPGDLVKTYHKGVWKVTSVVRRFKTPTGGFSTDPTAGPEMNALIKYDKVLNAKGKPAKGRNNCDAGFCEKLTKKAILDNRDEKIKQAWEEYDALLKVIDGN